MPNEIRLRFLCLLVSVQFALPDEIGVQIFVFSDGGGLFRRPGIVGIKVRVALYSSVASSALYTVKESLKLIIQLLQHKQEN